MTGWIRVSAAILQKSLLMPPAWNVCGVEFDADDQKLIFTVEGERLPAGHDGEIIGEFTCHQDGVYTRWRPASPPGPAVFLRESGTNVCFWCGQLAAEHGPGGVCRDQGLPRFKAFLLERQPCLDESHDCAYA